MPTSNTPESPAPDAGNAANPATDVTKPSSSSSKAKMTKARAKAAQAGAPKITKPSSGNPAWLVPTMLAMLVGGLVWVVLFYLTSAQYALPIPALGNWNIAVGFGMILAGGILSTRYK